MARKAYPTDGRDDAWAFVAPYVTLMTEEAPRRDHSRREVFKGWRWIVHAGATWRLMPHDLPPWHTVYQQSQRWLKAGACETMVHALRAVLRLAAGRTEEPSAALFHSRTLQSTPESGTRAGYDGAKYRRGSKGPMAVDILGHLLAAHVTAANKQDRSQASALCNAKLCSCPGEQRLRAAAQALGRRAQQRLGRALSSFGAG
jgi:transposase